MRNLELSPALATVPESTMAGTPRQGFRAPLSVWAGVPPRAPRGQSLLHGNPET